jgi:hypothetical protein
MTNISITLYTNKFFGAVLKSPIQRGSLSVNNTVTNISRLGTFNEMHGFYHEFQASLFANLYYCITTDQSLSLYFLVGWSCFCRFTFR